MKTRQANLEDKEEILKLVRGLYSRSSPEMIKKWIKNFERFKSGTFVVEENDKIIAYIAFGIKEDFLYIGDLYVKSKYRKRGFGKKLIEIVESAQKNLNKKNIIVNVRKRNTRAMRFYRKNGFKILKHINKKIVELIR